METKRGAALQPPFVAFLSKMVDDRFAGSLKVKQKVASFSARAFSGIALFYLIAMIMNVARNGLVAAVTHWTAAVFVLFVVFAIVNLRQSRTIGLLVSSALQSESST